MAHEARPERARLNAVEPGKPAAAAAAARPLARVAFTVPPVVLVGVGLLLAFRGGGIVSEEWAPVAVGTAVGLAVLGAVGSLPHIPRPAWSVLGALFAFVAWGALSLVWSASPEATVESVARLSLLLFAAVVGASYAARVSTAVVVAVVLAVAGAALTLTVEVKLLAGSTAMFSTTRLAWPIDYANGSAGLFFLSVPPLLAAAAAERIRPLGRALVAALAALAMSEGLMTLSRGAAIALAVTLVVCVALATARARFALTLACVALPVAVVGTRLTAGHPREVASDAVARGWAAAVAMSLAALLVALLASLEQVSPRKVRDHEGAFAVVVWMSALALGATAFVVHFGRPDTWLSARWHEFSHPELSHPGDARRFGNATSNRYDYWRVAAHTFEAHPLAGEGEGAFAVPWFRHRTIDESVTDAHSWEAAALAETGLVGFLLLATALVVPLVRVARARAEVGGFTAVALGGTVSYFVLHGSGDWLFLIPAIVLPAGVALGACGAAGRVLTFRLASGRQRAAVAVAAILAGVGAVPVYLTTTLTARAESQAATSTERALDTLSLAARVNPWAVQPLIVRSAVLEASGDPAGASSAAAEATRRGPNNWAAWIALAEVQRHAGHATRARAALHRAAALNPRAPQLKQLRR